MRRPRDDDPATRSATRGAGRRPGPVIALCVLVLLGATAGCTAGPVPRLGVALSSALAPAPTASSLSVMTLRAPADAVPSAASTSSVSSPAGSATSAAPPLGEAAALTSRLVVKGRAPLTDYERDAFGPSWSDDVGHVLPVSGARNGCDQRNDVLRRDLTQVVLKPGTNGCVAASGTLVDPYTGTVIAFVRGPRSAEVQIDHVVALADAWQKGAQQWDPLRRRDFAGDPLNLLAVKGSVNQSKGAGDAATWLPPRKAFRCDYAARIVAVKAKYGVWVTAAEKAALLRILDGCPGQPLPTGTAVAVPTIQR